MEIEAKSEPVEVPLGFYQAKVDDKGRLKLPVDFQQYLGKEKLFFTTLDTRIGRLYPLSVWRETEKLLEDQTEDAPAAEAVIFLAKHYGGLAEIDPQGRVLVPTDLRRELGMENEQVWLEASKDAVNVYSKQVYEDQLRITKENALANLKLMKAKKGFR